MNSIEKCWESIKVALYPNCKICILLNLELENNEMVVLLHKGIAAKARVKAVTGAAVGEQVLKVEDFSEKMVRIFFSFGY